MKKPDRGSLKSYYLDSFRPVSKVIGSLDHFLTFMRNLFKIFFSTLIITFLPKKLKLLKMLLLMNEWSDRAYVSRKSSGHLNVLKLLCKLDPFSITCKLLGLKKIRKKI